MNFLSPIAPACCSARCPWPRCSSWFQRLWGFGLGLFHLCISAFFVPQTQLIYSSRQDIGHTLPWKSWPEGLALAFGATWKAVVSLALSHECWWLLRHLLIKTSWWGENLLLWECWARHIWNELGPSTVNVNTTKPIFWDSSHCLRIPWLLKTLWSHMPQRSTLRFLFLFKDLFSLLDKNIFELFSRRVIFSLKPSFP